jgi:hypothetical protein
MHSRGANSDNEVEVSDKTSTVIVVGRVGSFWEVVDMDAMIFLEFG